MTGLTAYFGLMDICKPKAGNCRSLWSSWSRGIVVGQIAITRLSWVAGTDEKQNY
jgi:NADPH-dependent curcumin reductase CurA